MAATLVEHLPDLNDPSYAEEKKISQNAACLAYLGGADTVRHQNDPFLKSFLNHCDIYTLSAVYSFFLAMILYPDTQRKAQAELDAVIGQHRVPDFSDYDSLPYINALAKETMRWHLVTLLGITNSFRQRLRH